MRTMTEGKSSPYATFLYYYAKVFGLAPFCLKNDKLSEGSLCDKLWSITAIVIYVIGQLILITCKLAMTNRVESSLTKAGDVMSFQLGVITLVITVTTVWYKRNEVLEIIELFVSIGDLLKYFHIETNYEKMLKRQAIFVGSLFVIMMISEITIDVMFVRIATTNVETVPVIAIITSSLMSPVYHFVILNLLGVIVATKELHEKLNNVLVSSFGQREKLINCRRARCIDVNRYSSNSNSVVSSRDETKLVNTLIDIQGIHSDLHDLTEKITGLFSFPVLAVISFYFISIVTTCYYVYAGLREGSDDIGIGEALSSVAWISVLAAELIAIAVVCSSAENMGKSTARILHKIWIKHHPIEMIEEIQMLSLQLLQRPLTISAFGFFSLDYSYLYKIFCAVVAYFVIMVQLDTSKVGPGQAVDAPNATQTI